MKIRWVVIVSNCVSAREGQINLISNNGCSRCYCCCCDCCCCGCYFGDVIAVDNVCFVAFVILELFLLLIMYVLVQLLFWKCCCCISICCCCCCSCSCICCCCCYRYTCCCCCYLCYFVVRAFVILELVRSMRWDFFGVISKQINSKQFSRCRQDIHHAVLCIVLKVLNYSFV
jgi:hypothetical protein